MIEYLILIAAFVIYFAIIYLLLIFGIRKPGQDAND